MEHFAEYLYTNWGAYMYGGKKNTFLYWMMRDSMKGLEYMQIGFMYQIKGVLGRTVFDAPKPDNPVESRDSV